jgi:hypothetical protein
VSGTKLSSQLTHEQLVRYATDGFLDVTEPILSEEGVVDVQERIDALFSRWSTLPRRVKTGKGQSPPLTARIFRVTALDRAIARGQLVKSCREIAASIIGKREVWCRFDGAIYKYPGAGAVLWHQDIATSMTRMSPQSVHFWIPLNDHEGDSGCMTYLPGSHRGGVAAHRDSEGSEGTQFTAGPVCEDNVKSVPLSVGNFSVHSPMTMHGSLPNLGTSVRKALTLQFSSGPWSAARQFGRPLVRAIR